MKKAITILLIFFTLAMSGQIQSSQSGYFKGDSIHNRTTVIKAFIDVVNRFKADPNLEYADIVPYDYIRVYANDIFSTNSYTKDSIYNVFIAKDHSLMFTTTPDNQYTIVFDTGQSFTAKASRQLLIGEWADYNLRLYIDEVNGKEYIIKIDIL